VEFAINDKIFKEKFVVTEGTKTLIILGQSFCQKEEIKISFGEETRVEIGNKQINADILGKHRIITTSLAPVTSPMYRLGNELEKEASKIIEQHKRDGIIRDSQSAWRSPIILVKKKNGAYRLCVDYRALNDATVKDMYPMPRVDEVLDALAGANIFSKLDALSGFHQIEMHKDDIEKTAFGCREGLFEFVKMPFGLVNAPATFQRAMNRVLREYIGKFVMVYIDDIVIYSKSAEEHEGHLKSVGKAK
jgi:hypothetical protein